jgi:hypothetical protein
MDSNLNSMGQPMRLIDSIYQAHLLDEYHDVPVLRVIQELNLRHFGAFIIEKEI